jgi:hypothetical protein
VLLVFVGTGAAFAAGGFSDIAGNTHEQSILNMADRGVTEGYPDGTFRPNNPVTRGQMMTFLDRFQSGMGCTDCHDDTSLITSKETSWEMSLHGSGEAFLRGTSASCAGCHSGGAFSMMIAAGQNPGQVQAGDPEPTRQDCRTCHQIHTGYTGDDWALETTSPVALAFIPNATYNGGKGNLCANCHQPRRDAPVAANGMITGISEHWGPHHGPQSAMLLGVGGAAAPVQAAALIGSPSGHYNLVADTCVGCHLNNDVHTFEPDVEVCQSCHPGADDFDIDGVQTEVQNRLDAIGAALVAAGALTENTVDGHPTEDAIANGLPEDIGAALYNWLYIAHEDKSLGVHNPGYTRAMLTAAEDALGL